MDKFYIGEDLKTGEVGMLDEHNLIVRYKKPEKKQKLFSMNDEIFFKISQHGHNILDKEAEEFHRENPQVDIVVKWRPYKGEWYKQQLWNLFSSFGSESFNGSSLPVYDLTFIDPTELEDTDE